MTRTQDHRRHPRLSVECSVVLQDRLTRRAGRTSDLGPRGCQLLTSRPEAIGALVRLCIQSERVESPLEVVGQVVWSAGLPLPRAGISFIGTERRSTPSATDWFERLLAAELDAAARAGGRGPGLELPVRLGTPPRSAALTVEERAVALQVRAGTVLCGLLSSPAAAQVVSSMLKRRVITLVPGEAGAPRDWDVALAREPEARPRADGRLSGGFAKPPPDGFEAVCPPAGRDGGASSLGAAPRHLLVRSIEALVTGDVALAERMVRRALERAPGNAALACILAELEVHASRHAAHEPT